MEIIFNYDANKTHFHNTGFALSLVLKVTLFGTQKWPIVLIQLSRYKVGYGKYLHPVEVNTSIAQFCSKYRRENTAFIASKGHLPCKQSIYTRTCKVKNLETKKKTHYSHTGNSNTLPISAQVSLTPLKNLIRRIMGLID